MSLENRVIANLLDQIDALKAENAALENGNGMEIRELGTSGLKLSTLGFGCWQLGSAGTDDYWGLEYTQEMANQMIGLAMDTGVTYFDTAGDYANGGSEKQLGVAVKHFGARGKVVIGSKIVPNKCTDVIGECNAALERLQIDSIDLYMVHWPIDKNSMAHFAGHFTADGGRDYATTGGIDEHAVPPTTVAFNQLMQLQKEGKVKHIGVSNFGVNQLKEAMATGAKISINQLCYNLIFRAVEFDIIPFCKANGIGVIAYSPLMQGILTGRWKHADEVPTYRARSRHFDGGRDKSRHGEKGHEKLLFESLDKIRSISEREGIPMVELALCWPLHNDAVGTVIAGATKESQVHGNAKGVARKLSPAVFAELNAATEDLKQAMGSNADLWQGNDDARIK